MDYDGDQTLGISVSIKVIIHGISDSAALIEKYGFGKVLRVFRDPVVPDEVLVRTERLSTTSPQIYVV